MTSSQLALAVALIATTAAAADTRRGIEVADLDPTAEACTNFFAFANGKWRAENPIPPSMSRWSRRFEAGDQTKDLLRRILEEATAKPAPKGSIDRLIGDAYSSCMDESLIESKGLSPLHPQLNEISAITSRAAVQKQIARLHELGIDVPFAIGGGPDVREPNQVITHIGASGLGLPDRDYYLSSEPRFEEARKNYHAHVARMLALGGRDAETAASAASRVIELETALATASLSRVERRDPYATDHPMTLSELARLMPGFDWQSYLRQTAIPRARLNVDQPKFMEEVGRRLTETPVSTWKLYFEWHLLSSAAPHLARAFVEENFDFYERKLRGVQAMKPRWKRCVEAADEMLGEALGQRYVERHFPPAAKASMERLVANLLRAMQNRIEALAWMSGETKAKALKKLQTFRVKIGYPDKWLDYSKIDIRRGQHWQNVLAATAFAVQDDRQSIGKPVDRNRWGMTPPTSNAYYNPLLNEIVFPAGILQPPAFDLAAADAVNYGSIGVVIGHEVSHGFDDSGSEYDAWGRLKNWWTDGDRQQFDSRAQCVSDQFDGYFVEPGIAHRGALVLGEAIGDLAGARIAYDAYHLALAGKQAPVIDGFTGDQQFFIAWGQFRGDSIRPETQRVMVQSDPHPTGEYRVIGTVSNMPEFAKAFACAADSPMVRPPDKRCEVW